MTGRLGVEIGHLGDPKGSTDSQDVPFILGLNETIIPETVESTSEINPASIIADHCTGWGAWTRVGRGLWCRKLLPLSVGKAICVLSEVQIPSPRSW